MLSIVSWNVENVARLLAGDGLARWHERMASPDILCLQELRVRADDDASIAQLRDAIPGWRGGFSLNRDPVNARFRGGRAYGVGTWVRTALGPEHRCLEWDREGRILISRMPAASLVVINVYAVNGTSKPYFDHELGRFDGDRHAFKRRVIARLGETVAQLQQQHDLVLIGDWNVSQTAQDTWPRLRTEEPHATARREFAQRFVGQLDLVDAFRVRHPDTRRYTWFNPRVRRLDAARVDFALVSRTLLARIHDAAIDNPDMTRGVSDHTPIRLMIDEL